MIINLWELQKNLNWTGTAISSKGITQSSVNCLCHWMNGSRLIMNSRRKSEHFCDLLCIKINENTFIANFFLHFPVFFFSFFLFFCLQFCLLNLFEIIRCFVKSLSTTSTYFLMKHNWKNKTWFFFFFWGVGGTRIWVAKPVYWSPKHSGYLTENMNALRFDWYVFLINF